MRIDWINVLVGVVCIVIAGMLVGWISMYIPLPLPGFIWSAIAAFIGIIAWFAIMPRIKR